MPITNHPTTAKKTPNNGNLTDGLRGLQLFGSGACGASVASAAGSCPACAWRGEGGLGRDGAKQSNGINSKERGEGVEGQNGMLPKVTEDMKKEEELEGAGKNLQGAARVESADGEGGRGGRE
jgi:hypothetical protein